MQSLFHSHVTGLFIGVILSASAIWAQNQDSNTTAQPTPPEEFVTTNTVDAIPAPALDVNEKSEVAQTSDTPVEDKSPEFVAEEAITVGEEGPELINETETADQSVQPIPTQPVAVPVPAAPTVQLVPVMDPAMKEEVQALALRMAWVERSMGEQQDRALKGVMDANRTAIIIALTFGVIGFLALIVAAFVLSRAFQKFSDAALAMPTLQQLGQGARMAALEQGDIGTGRASSFSPFEQSNLRLANALEQLEHKIGKLESLPRHEGTTPGATPHGSWGGSPSSATNSPAPPANGGNGKSSASDDRATPADDRAVAIQALLDKGDALLNEDRAQEALECFEQIVVLNPDAAEAFIRRGMALEKLERLEAAIESYDEAIAANNSLTLAYLHKGAVCNRLQRHPEALECYEKALQTQHRS